MRPALVVFAAFVPVFALQAQSSYATPYSITTFAGSAGVFGSIDNTGTAARFYQPAGVAVDSSGNVFVADTANNTIRKITPTGVVTTIAGDILGVSGSTDSLIGTNARFFGPAGVAVDNSGNIYVADLGNHTIRKISSGGAVTTLAGSAGNSGSIDAPVGSNARFFEPRGVAVDSLGNVYVADSQNCTIRKITPAGAVTTFAGSAGLFGTTDDSGNAARFDTPYGVAVDSSDNIYVADTLNNTIRKITPGRVVSTLAGTAGVAGSIDATGTAARFNRPGGLAVDLGGNVFVADTLNHMIRKIGSGAVVTSLAGSASAAGTADGLGSAARFDGPCSIAVGSLGNIYVADTNSHTVRQSLVSQAALSVNSSASGTYGTAYNATASGGSGTGALSWSLGTGSTAAGAAIGSSTGAVTSTGTGTVVIKVTRVADANYLAATSADFTITLGKASAAVSLGNLSATYDGSAHAAIATTTPSSLAVTLTYNGSPTIPTNAGSYAVVGTVSDTNYTGTNSDTLVIAKATPVITWATPANMALGTALSSTQLNATANVAGSFVYSPVSGTVLAVGDQSLGVTFSPTDSTNYNTAAASVTVTVVGAAPAFLRQPSGHTFAVDYPVTLTATASGVPTPTYQWKKNGVAIVGATGGSYTIASTLLSDTASYTVVATNSLGSVTSNTAVLNVIPAPIGARKIPSDFNGDNKPDVFWQNTSTGDKKVWLMNGTAKASEVSLGTLSTDWQMVGTADFNGDNQTDVLWQNTLTGERGVWLMNGSNISGYVQIGMVDVTWNIAGAADFNGDGRPDVLWENTLTGERGIWLLNGTALVGWASLGTVAKQWSMAGMGDFNGDYQPDIVLQNTLTGERNVWLMNGTVKSSEISLGFGALEWSIGGIADYNGDGRTDILWQNTVTGEHGIWLMNGAVNIDYRALPTDTLDWVVGRIPLRPAATDFNLDGSSDLVWQNATTGERKIWLMNGTAFSSEISLGTLSTDWQIACIGDLDNDGHWDVIRQNTVTGERGVWLMNGTSISSFVSLGVVGLNWQIVGTGDFNDDNRTDILWQNTVTGERGIWLMFGTILSGWAGLGNVSTTWQIAGVADFNRDDQPDIIWQNTTTGERKVWYMNGTTFGSEASLGIVGLAWTIVGAADYNGDGSVDILWQNTVTGEGGIWLLNGIDLSGYVALSTQPLIWQIAN